MLALLPAGQTTQPPLGVTESPKWLPHGLVTPSDGDSKMSWVTCSSTEPQGPAEVGVVGSIPWLDSHALPPVQELCPPHGLGRAGCPPGDRPYQPCAGWQHLQFCVAGYSLWQVEEDMSLSRDGGCHGVGAALCATMSMHEAAVGSGD